MKQMRSLLSVLLLAAVVAAAIVSAGSAPSGKYCGSYLLGTVKGTAEFTDARKFTLKVVAFDKHIACENIEYAMATGGSELALPGATNTATCIGKVLADNQLTAQMNYNAVKDTIALNVGVAVVDMEKC